MAAPLRCIILLAACLLPRPAAAQPVNPSAAQPVDPTEQLFWDSVVDSGNPAEYRAYLQLYPTGRFADQATAHAGGPALPPATQAIALAVAQRHPFVPAAPITAQASDTGADCALAQGDIFAIDSVPAETDPGIVLRVVTVVHGNCRPGGTVMAARAGLADLLQSFDTSVQQRKLRAAAGEPERARWLAITASQRPADYLAYEKAYPDGPFTALANIRLVDLAAPLPAAANPAPAPATTSSTAASDALELAFWQSVEKDGSSAAYRSYLARFPNGTFADLAQSAIARLDAAAAQAAAEQQRAADEKARTGTQETETALSLSRPQWVLIQRSLDALGYQPGGADGVPGPHTRAAITQFQHNRLEPETGYFNQAQFTDLVNQAREPLAQADRERAAEQKRQADEAAQRAQQEADDQAQQEADQQAKLRRFPAVALAWTNEGGYAVRTGATSAEAQEAAMSGCSEVNSGCYLSNLNIPPGAQFCFAIAQDGQQLSYASAPSRSAATDSVVNNCSGNCVVKYSACNGN